MKKDIMTVDLFCGAGGATTGMELALRRLGMAHHGLAIDHWSVAVDTMRANHPCVDTRQMKIEDAIPSELVSNREVDILWASPSCTHHSRAKGGMPRSNQLRAQPELVLTWLDQLFVRRLIIENVPEFVEWGPLNLEGRPIEAMKGKCFNAWIDAIKARNYIVEWRIVNCADYGDATTRKRFFLKAVRKGCGKISWPEPEFGRKEENTLFGQIKKWRGIKECLDLSDTGKSIFNRKKQLSSNTLRRIEFGLRKYCGMQFKMDMLGSNGDDVCRLRTLNEPMFTQTCSNRTAIVQPFIVKLHNHATVESIEEPISTITCSGAHHLLCQPSIIDHLKNGKARPSTEPIGWKVIDIRIRMLKPSELAAAHSFPKDYVLKGNKTDQVKQIGNSVPVMTAAAMYEADLMCF